MRRAVIAIPAFQQSRVRLRFWGAVERTGNPKILHGLLVNFIAKGEHGTVSELRVIRPELALLRHEQNHVLPVGRL